MERYLEDFILDPRLAELEQRLKRFNIFRALDVVRKENNHSNFFAFLLDPQETHRLGDRILKGFLANAVRNKNLDITPLKIHLSQITDTRVYREVSVKGSKGGRIDILIETVIDGQNWVVAIENKVDAKQGEGQLGRYRKHCEETYKKTSQLLLIYLTPNGSEEPEEPEDSFWITVTYKEILESLAPIEGEIKNADDHSDFSFALLNYLDILRSDIMPNGDDEIPKLCREIFNQHRAAILEITKYSGDARSEAYDVLDKLISDQNGLGKKYLLDGDYLRVIRFIDRDIKDKLKKKFDFLDNKETKSGCPIFFSVINEPEMPLRVCMYVRLTGYDEQQRELLNSLANLIDAKNGRDWKRTDFHILVNEKMAEVVSINNEELQSKIKIYLKHYEDNIHPRLSEAIEKLDARLNMALPKL